MWGYFYVARERRVWKGPLSLDWGVSHLRRLFTPLFTHCHPQLIPHGEGAACSLQGPGTHPGPLWMPNWAYRSADWINSSVCGTFSPSAEEGVYSTPALADLVAGEGGGGGGAKGQRRELLKPSRKRVPFCWQTQARNVNWGQPEVSVFTGPAGFTRTECTHTHRQYTYCIYTVNSQDCLQ